MASPVRKQTTVSEEKKIVDLYESGMSISAIANHVGRSTNIVYSIITRNKMSNTPETPKKTGRPRKTTKREDRMMARTRIVDSKTAAEISRELEEKSGLQVSRQTVSRRLIEAGCQSRTPSIKPLISRKNPKAHLQFATEHVLWTPEEWAQFQSTSDDSDESEFNLLESDGEKTVEYVVSERLVPQYAEASLKSGNGRVIVWGIISALSLALWLIYLTR